MKYSAIIFTLFFPFFLFAQQNSVLSNGDWYKIFVEETGVYQITYDDLSAYGIDIENIDPQNLAIYGNPAGMLPESMEEPYYTDLQPLAIKVVGEEDGSFDPDDYILFYGQSPDTWELDEETENFHYLPNLYSDKTYYFLTVGDYQGKRMETQQSTEDDPTAFPDYYDLPLAHSEELVNPGKSGKRWLGEDFSVSDTLSFILNTEGKTLLSDSVYFHIVAAAKCSEVSELTININRELYKTIQLFASSDAYINYRLTSFDSICEAGGSDTRITFIFSRPNDSASAWIDYFELGFMGAKQLSGASQMSFRSVESTGPGEITEFSLDDENPAGLHVWNVTDPVNVKEVELNVGESSVSFRLPTDSLLEFHAFNGQSFLVPGFTGMVPDQNLHAMTIPDLLIVTYPDFMLQAIQIAAIHQETEGMSCAVVTPEEVYNEFSSGAKDITAIRNLVRYLYDLSGGESPSYLLLLGDASYDYKDRVAGNTDLVPTFESEISATVMNSFASDRYFGLQAMDDAYGSSPLPVGVGRIPAKNVDEANAVMNKLWAYQAPGALGVWKNEFMFIGDDGDANLHMKQADMLGDTLDVLAPVENNTKCYLDFYPRVTNENGHGYPEAKELIDEKMNTGVFYVNYTGHGWSTQLAEENVVNSESVDDWSNGNYLPLWVTASGGVVHFDDPDVVSLAEQILLKDDGGSIGFIGNTRPGFASANLALNMATLAALLEGEQDGNTVRLGDLMMRSEQHRSERWTLLGDPAMRIAFPRYNVYTTTLNGVEIGDFTDTIAPGDRITLEGLIKSKTDGAVQTGFNGTVYLKVYAPPYVRSTLGNQGTGVIDFTVQDSVLVESSSEVVNGAFEISVRLPSAYYESFGLLKLSWYADNSETDASGYYTGPVFGGEPNSVDEFQQLAGLIKVYPSPFTDQITIRMPEANTGTVSFSVYNMMGSEVYSGQIDGRLHQAQVNLTHLSKGLYMLNMSNSKFQKSFKVLKN